MSREDIHETYDRGEIEVVELGLDHNGKKQWFYSSREGWEETGLKDGCLMLDCAHYKVGTRIELSETIEHDQSKD